MSKMFGTVRYFMTIHKYGVKYPKNHTALIQQKLNVDNQSLVTGLPKDLRAYCNGASKKSEEYKTESGVPPRPIPPALPDPKKVEKMFFRTLAFAWDFSYFTYLWTKRTFHIHVVQNPTLRSFVQTIAQKMEEAKKD